MHIEHLGEKTYLMSFDATQAEPMDDGSFQHAFRNGSTETRLSIPSQLMSGLPDTPCMVVVTGPAKLKVWVNAECGISGVEEMDVEAINLSEAAQRETDFSAVIPF